MTRLQRVIAFLVALVWFASFVAYSAFNWCDIWNLKPNEFGDFLAGWFATAAFLALMLAVWLQKEELAAQREELARSTTALEAQSQASQVDLLFRIDEFYAQRLTYHIDHILKSTGLINRDERKDLWQLFSSGNRLIIARFLLNLLKRPGEETQVGEAIQKSLGREGLSAINLAHSLRAYSSLVEDYKRSVASLGYKPEETGFNEFIEISERLSSTGVSTQANDEAQLKGS